MVCGERIIYPICSRGATRAWSEASPWGFAFLRAVESWQTNDKLNHMQYPDQAIQYRSR